MKSPILGAAYVARSINAADNRLINMYAEATPDGGKTAAYFQRAPGIKGATGFIGTGSGPVRGMWVARNVLYVVAGSVFYSVTATYSATAFDTTSYTLTVIASNVAGTGPVSMVDNGQQIFIATNPKGYIYNIDTGVFNQIGDPDFPGAVTVGYVNGYFVFNEPNSARVWVTALYDGNNIDALSFASAEASPDNVVSLIVDHKEIWIFGNNSTEVWYDAGQPDYPLAPIQGAFLETGCAAPYSVAKMDNSVFWLAADARGYGMVYRARGYQPQRISTHAIEYAIQSYATISDAIAYTYQQDGHFFYVLTFPTANVTWVYDAATNMWHQRGYIDAITGQYLRHTPTCAAAYFNRVYVGSCFSGLIGRYDFNTYVEFANSPQGWLRSWRALPTGENTLKRTAHHSLQLDCEAGTSLNSVVGSPSEQPPLLVGLRWSDDGGHTWSNQVFQSVGAQGQTGKRVIWRRLGMTTKLRDRVYEISASGWGKTAIMGAELLASGTNA
jgi:hypothetical protein